MVIYSSFNLGNSALHYAVKKTNVNIVNMLINANIHVLLINNEKLSPIDYSIRLNATSIYEILAKEVNKGETKKIVKQKEKVIDDKFETNGDNTNLNEITNNSNNNLTNSGKKNLNSNNNESKSKKSLKNLSNYSEQFMRYPLNLSSSLENTDVQISIDIPCSFESEEKNNSNVKNQVNSFLSNIHVIFRNKFKSCSSY